MRDLLVIVPSRGRPGSIRRLQDAMDATCRGDTTLLIGLDEDDPDLPRYLARQDHPRTLVKVLPGLRFVVAWLNALAVPRVGEYRCIGTLGDDNVPQTDGWDTAIMEALERTPLAFGNDQDDRPAGSLCEHVFMRGEVIAALGYMGPPSIRHMYVDPAWMAWGTACGITYLHEVNLEHRHYTVGKAPEDDSYRASTALIPSDLVAYNDYCYNGALNADIRRLGGQEFTAASIREFNARLNIPLSPGLLPPGKRPEDHA